MSTDNQDFSEKLQKALKHIRNRMHRPAPEVSEHAEWSLYCIYDEEDDKADLESVKQRIKQYYEQGLYDRSQYNFQYIHDHRDTLPHLSALKKAKGKNLKAIFDDIDYSKITTVTHIADNEFRIPPKNVFIEVSTNFGRFDLAIDMHKFACSGWNFVDLVENHFYNGMCVHSMVPEKYMQFGHQGTKSVSEDMYRHSIRKSAIRSMQFSDGYADPQSEFRVPGGDNQMLYPSGILMRDQIGCLQEEDIERYDKFVKENWELDQYSVAYYVPPRDSQENPNNEVTTGSSQIIVNFSNNIQYFKDKGSQHYVFGKVWSGYAVINQLKSIACERKKPNVLVRINYVRIKDFQPKKIKT